MRIAFIACNKNRQRFGQDPAFIYRCDNLAHGLRCIGFEVWVGHVTSFPWWQTWDATVFHRPRNNWRLSILSSLLHRKGTRLIADFDDLVFDPDMACFSPGVLNGTVPLDVTTRQFKAHRAALAAFDVVTLSTTPLAKHVACIPACSVRVVVIPNALHWSWLTMNPHAITTEHQVISYMPGTSSHDRDFAIVAPGLAGVMQRHPGAQLVVTGPLNFSIPAVTDRVAHKAKLPFQSYHEAFKGVHVNLAPLEATPFTECKSAIKVMEAAWWGVPTVCSTLPDAARFADAGAVIVNSPSAFAEATDALLREGWHDRDLRDKVRPLADIHAVARQWCADVLERPEV